MRICVLLKQDLVSTKTIFSVRFHNNLHNVKKLVSNVLASKKYPEQAYRTCIGIINLVRKYGNRRVDRACKRALSFKLFNYRAVKNILDKGLDKIDEEKVYEQKLPLHQNIRGAGYYKLT